MRCFSIDRFVSLLAVACSVLLMSACATTVSTQTQIEERVMGRWDSLLSGDLAGAYEYLSPGYRSSVSSLQYQRSMLLKRVSWKSAKYIESECAETVCNVKISLGFAVYGALPGVKSYEGTQTVKESWLLVNGQWYFVPGE